MTGKPTNCTGSSKSGVSCCARTTALSLKSIILNISAVKSASDGNITCSCIFLFVYFFEDAKIKLFDMDSRWGITNSAQMHTRKPEKIKSNIHNYFQSLNSLHEIPNINWNQICDLAFGWQHVLQTDTKWLLFLFVD